MWTIFRNYMDLIWMFPTSCGIRAMNNWGCFEEEVFPSIGIVFLSVCNMMKKWSCQYLDIPFLASRGHYHPSTEFFGHLFIALLLGELLRNMLVSVLWEFSFMITQSLDWTLTDFYYLECSPESSNSLITWELWNDFVLWKWAIRGGNNTQC